MPTSLAEFRWRMEGEGVRSLIVIEIGILT